MQQPSPNPHRDLSGALFAALQRLLPQQGLSRLIGHLAEARTPWLKRWLIESFIRAYQVDWSDAQIQDLRSYENFNAFFTRRLRPGARPLDSSPGAILSPADGAVSQFGALTGKPVQAKGHRFSAHRLLASDEDAAGFANGQFATIYLSPRSYHRVHMPLDGKLLRTRYIPGKLFSVSNATARHIPGIFARNERLACLFETPLGRVAVVMVGAMLVAGISTVWRHSYPANPNRVNEQLFTEGDNPQLGRGDELGHFSFGSTVILLFEQGAVRWNPNLQNGAAISMGERLATASQNRG